MKAAVGLIDQSRVGRQECQGKSILLFFVLLCCFPKSRDFFLCKHEQITNCSPLFSPSHHLSNSSDCQSLSPKTQDGIDISMSDVKRSTTPPRSTHASYHPGGYGVSRGLQRARRPFLVKNALTGGAIMGFAVGVYWYSISKVSKNDLNVR